MLRKLNQGFTLIELMIVVAIIGILAAIAIPNFVKFQCRSKQSEAKGNLKAIYVAEESYRAERDVYAAITAVQASGNANDIGFNPKGTPIRYQYDTTITATPTFSGTASGTVDAVTGDKWTIDNNNTLLSVTNKCQ